MLEVQAPIGLFLYDRFGVLSVEGRLMGARQGAPIPRRTLLTERVCQLRLRGVQIGPKVGQPLSPRSNTGEVARGRRERREVAVR